MRSKIPGGVPSLSVIVIAVVGLVEQRVLGRADELRLHENSARTVVRRSPELALRALEPGADADFGERAQDQVRLCGVTCDRDRHQSFGHEAFSSSGWAPPRRSAGSPRSGSGSSIVSKSLGTTVAANTARASSLIIRGVARAPRCVSASIFTSLSAASSAASAAVE